MKLIILLFAIVIGFGLACKETFDACQLLAQPVEATKTAPATTPVAPAQQAQALLS